MRSSNQIDAGNVFGVGVVVVVIVVVVAVLVVADIVRAVVIIYNFYVAFGEVSTTVIKISVVVAKVVAVIDAVAV